MTHFFSFVLALFVTLVTIPVLIRFAGRLRLVDIPDARKVHAVSIPRCGGIAIALGTVVPVLMWVPLDRATAGGLVGAGIIVAFGVWDDVKPLDYGWKLLGQALAVGVVMAGGVVIEHVPLFGLDPAPVWVSYPLTALFILGVTNAVNLFDGLDGLAGGCALLTLSAVATLAYLGQGFPVTLIVVAIAGSIFGFLRYNTHPASVFMGDAGSQFLGFTTAVLTIFLIERCDRALNPGLPLLLLGLPLLDTGMVVVQRLWAGRSPFSADRNHLHHKLLSVGFSHYEAVSLIYAVQAVMVLAAFLLRYETDGAVLSAFVLISGCVLVPLLWFKSTGRRVRAAPPAGAFVERRNLWLRRWAWLPAAAQGTLGYGVAVFLVVGALGPVSVAPDVSVLAVSVVGLWLGSKVFVRSRSTVIERVGVYLAVILAAYLFATWQAEAVALRWAVGAYLIGLTGVLVVAIRVTRRDLFQVTPQDLLILFLAFAIPNLSGAALAQYRIGETAVMLVVLFYASEFILTRDDRGWRVIEAASLVSLSLIGIRGLVA